MQSTTLTVPDGPNFKNETWLLNGDATDFCASNREQYLDQCKQFVATNYDYHIDLAPNLVFTLLFALSMIAFGLSWILARRAGVFTIALMIGCLLEILGYVGRMLSWRNPWAQLGFLLQICCLTIAPAFMAAGIYLCLRKIVFAFGQENSRISAKWYTRIFIPCDILSLVLQATGGALASEASSSHTSTKNGTDIMIAGLAFQVFTLCVFVAAAIDFSVRVGRMYKIHGEAALNQDPAILAMRRSWPFKGFLLALGLAVVLIVWRSSFRVAELCQGWHGPIIKNQGMFVGFEGVLIIAAVIALNIFNPAFCASELFEDRPEGGLTKPVGMTKTVDSSDSDSDGPGFNNDAEKGFPWGKKKSGDRGNQSDSDAPTLVSPDGNFF